MSEKVEKFINDNKEVFVELTKIMRETDTVRGVDTLQEMKARQKAIRIVNEWIGTLWGIAYNDLPKVEEEDELYRINN